MAYRCFVISPIGEEGSAVRQAADRALKHVIMPALEIYGFDVIRSDKMTTSGSITEEVIELVQGAELCIVDLTGQNPNVFYECGRRHESGKPFIHVVEKGAEMPFDLRVYRAIEYDLSDLDSAAEAKEKLRHAVETILKEGFGPRGSGSSLAGVADTLNRIERKLMSIQGSHARVADDPGKPITEIDRMFQPVIAKLEAAIQRGDVEGVVALLPEVERDRGICEELLAAGRLTAMAGKRLGVELLERVLAEELQLAETESWCIVDGISQYYMQAAEVEKALRYEERFMAIAEVSSHHSFFGALIWNTLVQLLFVAGRHDEARECSDKALKISDEIPAVWFWRAQLAGVDGDLSTALEAAERAVLEADKMGGVPEEFHSLVESLRDALKNEQDRS